MSSGLFMGNQYSVAVLTSDFRTCVMEFFRCDIFKGFGFDIAHISQNSYTLEIYYALCNQYCNFLSQVVRLRALIHLEIGLFFSLYKTISNSTNVCC